MSGSNVHWSLNVSEAVWERDIKAMSPDTLHPLCCILRVRDEALILKDTLDHLAEFADIIVAYDDASSDETADILKAHPKVMMVIQNTQWLSNVDDRLLSETRHRGLLLQEAQRRFNFRWCMCCDADERYLGPIRTFVMQPLSCKSPKGIRLQLFDAYMTIEDKEPFKSGDTLMDFRRYFGPERRDILMLWQNDEHAQFQGLDAREPTIMGDCVTDFYVQHYGKSLSKDHWESTCDYYVNHFPYDPYGKKWSARKGKGVHTESDFNRPLYVWGDDLFLNAVTGF